MGNSVRPKGWALTEEYLASHLEDEPWTPKLSYYTALVRRLVLGGFAKDYIWNFNIQRNMSTFICF